MSAYNPDLSRISSRFVFNLYPGMTDTVRNLIEAISVLSGGFATAWAAGTTYKVGDIRSDTGKNYSCKTAHTASALFITDAAKWDELTTGGSMVGSEITITGGASVNATLISDAAGILSYVKNNYTAAVAPAITDNFAAGYRVSSRWMNTVTTEMYVCMGDGVWETTTLTIDDIQSLGLGKKYYHGVIARTVGAANPLPTHLTTTTFTLGATANPISYWYQGSQVDVIADKTATLSEGAGLYFVYFNAATGNILATKAFPGISNTSNVIIATVIWNGSDYGLVQDERHGYARDNDWHSWAHSTVGVRYKSGITLTHNSGTGAAATFATTLGEIMDEDILFAFPASSAFPTANTGRAFYQTGAATYAFVNTPITTPGYLGANGRPNYVNSSYALVQATSSSNRYFNTFVYASTDLHTPLYFFTETVSATVASNNGHSSTTNARAIPFPNLSGFGLSPELKPIYRLIWKANGELQAIDTTLDDYRTVTSLPQSAGFTTASASGVAFNPASGLVATNVQAAIEEAVVSAVLSITTAGGTTASASTDRVVEFTGTATQAYTLPTRTSGRPFKFCNNSTLAVTINGDAMSSGGTAVVLNAGDSCQMVGGSINWMVF